MHIRPLEKYTRLLQPAKTLMPGPMSEAWKSGQAMKAPLRQTEAM